MRPAMGAPFCAVVAGVDLRASRKDTAPTQRTLYQLQQAEALCPDMGLKETPPK